MEVRRGVEPLFSVLQTLSFPEQQTISVACDGGGAPYVPTITSGATSVSPGNRTLLSPLNRRMPSPVRRGIHTAPGAGVEPTISPLTAARVAISPPWNETPIFTACEGSKARSGHTALIVPTEGFEPPTFGLQNRCTTTVLSRHYWFGLQESDLSKRGQNPLSSQRRPSDIVDPALGIEPSTLRFKGAAAPSAAGIKNRGCSSIELPGALLRCTAGRRRPEALQMPGRDSNPQPSPYLTSALTS